MYSFLYKYLIILINLIQFTNHFKILFQINKKFKTSTNTKSQLKFLEKLNKLKKKRHNNQK